MEEISRLAWQEKRSQYAVREDIDRVSRHPLVSFCFKRYRRPRVASTNYQTRQHPYLLPTAGGRLEEFFKPDMANGLFAHTRRWKKSHRRSRNAGSYGRRQRH